MDHAMRCNLGRRRGADGRARHRLASSGVPSNLATAIHRTVVVLVFAWAIALGLGEHRALGTLSRRSLVFLVLSALATGISWLAYYRALQMAPASRVAPIDKLSLPLTLIFAAVFLGEAMTWRLIAGVTLMTAECPSYAEKPGMVRLKAEHCQRRGTAALIALHFQDVRVDAVGDVNRLAIRN